MAACHHERRVRYDHPRSSGSDDAKPIILVPNYLGSDLALLPLAMWLKALGYRPTTAGLFLNLQDSMVERTVSRLITDITDRVGRKAILIAHSTGMPLVVRAAGA